LYLAHLVILTFYVVRIYICRYPGCPLKYINQGMNAIWLYLLLNSIALRILFAFTPQHERKIGRTIKLKNGQMHTHTDFFSIKNVSA